MTYSDSLKRKIIAHGITRGIISGVEVEDYARECGYSAENGRRRMRELCVAGLFKAEYEKKNGKRFAKYRYTLIYEDPKEPQQQDLLTEATK